MVEIILAGLVVLGIINAGMTFQCLRHMDHSFERGLARYQDRYRKRAQRTQGYSRNEIADYWTPVEQEFRRKGLLKEIEEDAISTRD